MRRFGQVVFLLLSIGFGFTASPQAVRPQAGENGERVIVFIGDSLTAGYGVKKEEAFPDKAGEILRADGHKVKIINGGISGSVTAEANSRVRWFLRAKPSIIVLELGGNDGLNGAPIATIKKNLGNAIVAAQAGGAKVLLLGMRVYTNFGDDYQKKFENIYKDLAQEHKVQLMPFLLKSVAMKRELNQADLKHPNAQGHALVAKDVAAELEKLL
jgi:acyl-CoA thioesterase-1